MVAPARERGLKSTRGFLFSASLRRSREGAWIEIFKEYLATYRALSVAPARERGLKFASSLLPQIAVLVAPARERGLKCVLKDV